MWLFRIMSYVTPQLNGSQSDFTEWKKLLVLCLLFTNKSEATRSYTCKHAPNRKLWVLIPLSFCWAQAEASCITTNQSHLAISVPTSKRERHKHTTALMPHSTPGACWEAVQVKPESHCYLFKFTASCSASEGLWFSRQQSVKDKDFLNTTRLHVSCWQAQRSTSS